MIGKWEVLLRKGIPMKRQPVTEQMRGSHMSIDFFLFLAQGNYEIRFREASAKLPRATGFASAALFLLKLLPRASANELLFKIPSANTAPCNFL